MVLRLRVRIHRPLLQRRVLRKEVDDLVVHIGHALIQGARTFAGRAYALLVGAHVRFVEISCCLSTINVAFAVDYDQVLNLLALGTQ